MRTKLTGVQNVRFVAPARRSAAARRKAAQKRTADAPPVLSFRSLLSELVTFSRNTMAVANAPEDTFLLYAQSKRCGETLAEFP